MSKLVRTIDAFVGETVRIRWRRLPAPHGLPIYDSTSDPIDRYETLVEDHTAPPPDTWKARMEKQNAGSGTEATARTVSADGGD